jgi:hypothetical protein
MIQELFGQTLRPEKVPQPPGTSEREIGERDQGIYPKCDGAGKLEVVTKFFAMAWSKPGRCSCNIH